MSAQFQSRSLPYFGAPRSWLDGGWEMPEALRGQNVFYSCLGYLGVTEGVAALKKHSLRQ